GDRLAAGPGMKVGGLGEGGELGLGDVEFGERERFGERHRVLWLTPARLVDRDIEAFVLARRGTHLEGASRDHHHLGTVGAIAKGLWRRGACRGRCRGRFWCWRGLRRRCRWGGCLSGCG